MQVRDLTRGKCFPISYISLQDAAGQIWLSSHYFGSWFVYHPVKYFIRFGHLF